MKFSLRLLSTASILCATGFATTAQASEQDVKSAMAEASTHISTLIPYAYDDNAFRADANRPIISEHLNSLETLFAKKVEALGKQSDTAWITLKVMQDHLRETTSLYNSGYFAMSQYLLTSTPAICSTCHIQDSAHSSIGNQLSRKHFANDYSYAEYLFTIRNYDSAQSFYEQHLQQDEAKASRFRYLKPLERLLTIELGIRQSIPKAKMLLESHHKATELIEIEQVISEWLEGVNDIKSAGGEKPQQLKGLFKDWFSNSPGNSHEFILDEKRRPQAIWLRAKLYDALNKDQAPNDAAETLYMLAIIDRVLGQNEPYSFANLYLKQCVSHYPQTPSAKRCLEEYKNHLSFYYGGSAGEAVPEELVDEYNALKQKLEQNKK